ncbi:MAG: rhodanese-like domain-containing protein [Ignavibacteriae bacterium]|nr:rhodanese-like domain-containing protein [Ignavibacteriota bacterium]
MKSKINYKAMLLILASSILLGFIYNTFSSDGIDLIRKSIIVESVKIGEGNSSENTLRGIDISQAIKLHNDNSAIFIDARDQWEFSESHISGAISIPEFSFVGDDSLLNSITKESLIVVYCDGDDCDVSKRLAQELVELGYQETYVFLGGMKEWMEAELPINKGLSE